MPLVCQTRLTDGRATPAAALDRGEGWLAHATTRRRVDLWATWSRLADLQALAPALPDDFAGFWMDVTGRASAGQLERYESWARRCRGGSLRLQCLDLDRQSEAVIAFDGPPVRAVDDPALDPRFAHQAAGPGLVSYIERGVHGAGAARMRLSAARVHGAYERLGEVLPGVPELVLDGVDMEWADVPAFKPSAPWASSPSGVSGAVRALRLSVSSGAPDALHVELGDEPEARLAAWRAWVGLLHSLDVVVVRCTGTLAELEALLEELEPEGHPDRPGELYGISTLDQPALEPELLADVCERTAGAGDWGLRWSNLCWRLEPEEEDAGSFYYVRTERRRTYDNLVVALDLDDPQADRFRAARRQLARLVEEDLGNAAAWSFEGAPTTTPRGRRYQTLTRALREAAEAVCEDPAPLPKRPGRTLGPLRALWGLLRSDMTLDVVGAAERALAEVAPGFRYDRRAHATDVYFVELVRETPHGFQYLQLQRSHAPPGHAVRVAVSRFRARLDELDPGSGRAAHGLVLPLEELAPGRGSWAYSGQGECDAAMVDMARVVAARVLPFFERAEALLSRFA